MSATLRIHRGHASADRILMVGSDELGRLAEAVTTFTVPAGHHVIRLKLGPYHSVATQVEVAEGAVLDLKAVEDPDAILPLVQGGYLKLEPASAQR
ncbi:MAG: hypothetical protein M9891_06700 [Austwickia sp.]|nr:hypothetical protein [Actinomycetota bacterium]MCO5308964.1 hypothetical protein [Austwickia sp.]